MFHFNDKGFRDRSRPFSAVPEPDRFHLAALDAAGVGTWCVEIRTGRATWDATSARILGFECGRTDQGTHPPIHQSDRRRVASSLKASLRTGERGEVEFRIVRPDGAIRWLRAIARPDAGSRGGERWVGGVILDITDKKISELELAESRRRLATMIDNLPGIAYRCEAAAPWQMSYISEGVEELTGWTVAEMISGSRTWADVMHPDDIAAVEQDVLSAMAEQRQFSVTYRIVQKSGAIRWVHERGKATRDEYGQTFLEGFVGDVTDQKLMEASLRHSEAEAQRNAERLRAALEGTMDCVFSVDRKWRITDLNARAKQDFGKEGSLVGRNILSVFPSSGGSLLAECCRRVMNTGVAETLEACFQPEKIWYETHVTPTDEGITIFYRDVSGRKEVEEQLKASRTRVQEILNSVPQVIWSATPEGLVDYISNQWQEFSWDQEGDPGDWLRSVHPDDQQLAFDRWRTSVKTGQPYEVEFRIRGQSGTYAWIMARARPVRDGAGQIVRWYGTCTDVNERVRAQAALRDSEAINRSIIDATPDCISMLDMDGNVLFTNDAALRALGLTNAESLLHKPWGLAFYPGVRGAAKHALASARDGRIGHFTALQAGSGEKSKWWDVVVAPVTDDAGTPTKLVVISRDITHQKTAEERVRWTANHDVLTQLPNRAFFQQTLDQKLRDAELGNAKFGILLLDLDNFKQVNDTLGHDAGDALLCCFADQLRAAARADDFIARLGGDEFAIILNGVCDRFGIESAVQAILSRLKEPCVYGNKLIDCQASIGASLYPEHGTNRTELLKNADIALYVAKSSGRGVSKQFDASMRAEIQQRVSMLSLARDALADNRVEPFFQPKVDLKSGALAGFEALLRWHDARRGLQLPETISAAFHDLELAAQISDQMIEKVIHHIRAWLEQGVSFGHVAVNAAAAEFRRGNFAERLLEQLRLANIPTSMFQVEVTETVFLGRGAEYVERALKTLSREGIGIALDDFGTGYASLSHLKQFPVDLLKIDRSFVRDIAEDPDDAAIVRAVINLGKSLGIDTVAEGVETEEQARFLSAQGCDFAQGFLYGKAIPVAAVPALIANWEAGAPLRAAQR